MILGYIQSTVKSQLIRTNIKLKLETSRIQGKYARNEKIPQKMSTISIITNSKRNQEYSYTAERERGKKERLP